MKTALLDTNILLDFALAREDFLEPVIQIWQLVADEKVDSYVSASSITDIYYILRKQQNAEKAFNFIKELTEIVQIATVDTFVVQTAFTYPLKDFEDAIQLATAKHASLEYLITRNQKDFQNQPTNIQIKNPKEFLELF